MKKIFFVSILFFSCIFISCRTQEQKVDKLIEDMFFKTLYDFESYQKIETKIVGTANRNGLNSEECIEDAKEIVALMKDELENISKAVEALKEANGYYSSLMRAYYLSIADEYHDKYMEQKKERLGLRENLKNKIKKYNHNEIIGYEVIHRFRCKNRGGRNCIADYRFIVDSKIEKILFYNDLEEENYTEAIELIQDIEKEIQEENNINS